MGREKAAPTLARSTQDKGDTAAAMMQGKKPANLREPYTKPEDGSPGSRRRKARSVNVNNISPALRGAAQAIQELGHD